MPGFTTRAMNIAVKFVLSLMRQRGRRCVRWWKIFSGAHIHSALAAVHHRRAAGSIVTIKHERSSVDPAEPGWEVHHGARDHMQNSAQLDRTSEDITQTGRCCPVGEGSTWGRQETISGSYLVQAGLDVTTTRGSGKRGNGQASPNSWSSERLP